MWFIPGPMQATQFIYLFDFTAWVQHEQLNSYIHKLNHAEGPLATSASGLSTLSIKKINYSKVYS